MSKLFLLLFFITLFSNTLLSNTPKSPKTNNNGFCSTESSIDKKLTNHFLIPKTNNPVMFETTQNQEGWPFPVDNVSTLSMRVHAIFLSDDDGGRATNITPEQVAIWVDTANKIYAKAKIQLEFDEGPDSEDLENLNNTSLNSMIGNSDPNWGEQSSEAANISHDYPNKLVVFFRWGSGQSPTGGGFSWTNLNFIVMPGFDDTWICGEKNKTLFAHEVGHYLGLPHTFAELFAVFSEAETYLDNHNQNILAFDGDGRSGTSPDPYVSGYDESVQCDTTVTSVTLNGIEIEIPRKNVMSYYYNTSEVINSQIGTIRQGMLVRLNQSYGLEKYYEEAGLTFLEAESRETSVTDGEVSNQALYGFLGKWSNNFHLLWVDGSVGATMTLDIEAPEDSEYDVYASFTAAPNFGIYNHEINDQSVEPIDFYAGIVMPTGLLYLGSFQLDQGANEWKVISEGSNEINPDSYGYGLDYILLEKKAPSAISRKTHQNNSISLRQNSPNPFSNKTTIGYSVPNQQFAKLEIYNIAGQLVKTLVNNSSSPGVNLAKWRGSDKNGNSLPSGVYIYKLQSSSSIISKKMLLLR